MKKFACIVGARPNFMKMAPILRAFEGHDAETVLVHTGQHYDKNLSGVFFEELGIKKPDVSLGVGSGSHAQQTAKLLTSLEDTFVSAKEEGSPFDRVVVVGDVNSTMAATLAATKLHIPVAHVEAGLRSFDRNMPEEINRLVTDSLSDLLLCSEPSGVEHLKNEGHREEDIKLVGNVMIDTLLRQVEAARQQDLLNHIGLEERAYCVVTLHRPSNVDSPDALGPLIDVLIQVSDHLPIVFPVHPRTRARLDAFGLNDKLDKAKGFHVLEPLGYNDFLCLTSQARVIVTDSGGLQEESTALEIPCLTMRQNTERPVTVTEGTSTLCGSSASLLNEHLAAVLSKGYKVGKCPPLWDGNAAVRIVAELMSR